MAVYSDAATILHPSIVAKEALISLKNQMVFGNLVYTTYSEEYKKVGDTVLIRKPAEFSTVHDFQASATVVPTTLQESSVSVVLDKWYDITFPISAKELSLDIVSFREQCIAPAMRAHAQALDQAIAGLFVDVAAHYPVSSTAVVEDIAGVRTQLNLNKVPFDSRYVVLHPQTEQSYITLDAFLHAEKRGDTRAIKEANMGRVFGMDWYMDQNVPTHTSDSGTATATLSASADVDATSVIIQGNALHGIATVASITLVPGDVFKIDGETLDIGHRVTTELIGDSASAETVLISPPIGAGGVLSGATVTFQLTHKANIAFHRNAFALVTAPLEPPMGGPRGEVETHEGISARVVYGYDQLHKENDISIDILFGVKTLDKQLACRLSDAR